MSSGVVYKQWYKPRNIPSTGILNQKHLVYMATRPGAIHNPECSFGLWGRLPDVRNPENINNLRLAKQAVAQASKSHTLWRAVISLDGEEAKIHGYYERKAWEALLNKKIDILAKEMGIRQADFCWVASMHYEKSHPHVHIMYWDNSDAIHEEHIPEARFEILAEHVRAAFNAEIYRDELQEQRVEKNDMSKALRLELRALIKEVNLADALDLSHITKPVQDRLVASFAELAANVPTRGSIDYAYLKPDYKAKVDALTDEILKISDFRRYMRQYESAVKEICKLYGNGEEKTAFELKRAKEAIYKNCGNEIMSVIREYRNELTRTAPTENEELKALLRTTASAIIPTSPAYQELLQKTPKLRTPIHELMKDEEFRKVFRRACSQALNDVRINARLNGYIKATGKGLSKDEWKAYQKDIYRDARRTINGLVKDQLFGDARYQEQAQADAVGSLLIRLLREVGRSTGQQQARRDLAKSQSRDMSKTAMRDRMAQKEQGSELEQ